MSILDWLRSLAGGTAPDPVSRVATDRAQASVTFRGGAERVIRWTDLDDVMMHWAGGRFSPVDNQCVLRTGGGDIRVASTVPGFGHLLDQLSLRPEFDRPAYESSYRIDLPVSIWNSRRTVQPDAAQDRESAVAPPPPVS